MHKILAAVILLFLGILACSQAATPSPVQPTPLPTLASPTPPTTVAALTETWFILRGGEKSDQAWGVDVDDKGNIYLAAFEQKTNQWFTDMAIYKFSPEGEEIWRTEWGGQFQEKAFILQVTGSVVYVGGLTHDSINLEDNSMAILALDAETGELAWETIWGQGPGYEEVDGLVVMDDAIYISGWTTSPGTGYDAGILKLDLDGKITWENTWGTDGFDTADGQLVVAGDSVYVSGRLGGTSMFTGGQSLIARFSRETGELIQHAVWGNTFFTDGLGMTGDADGLYVVGMEINPGTGSQVFLLKYSLDLELLWEKRWGDEAGEHVARAAELDGSGNVIIGVNSRATSGGPTDIVLVKYSPDGKVLWESRWGEAEEEELVHGLVVSGNALFIAGEIKYADPPQNDALLIKTEVQTGQFPSK